MKNFDLTNDKSGTQRRGNTHDAPSMRFRLNSDSLLSRFCLASLICLCMLTLGVGNAWGAANSVSINGNAITGFGSGSNYTSGSFKSGDITIESNSGFSTTQFRVAKSKTLTISTNVGKITKIVVNCSSSNYKFNDNTNLSYSGTAGTYTNAAGVTSITFTNSNANIARITSIVITYGYLVTYDKNGGTGTATDSDSPYAKNATVTTKAANTFTAPDGKTFAGWNTDANGSGTSYVAGATFKITANTTLYAQWEAAAPAYSVTWTINPAAGGTLSATSGTSTTVTPNAAYTYGSPAYTVTSGSATVSQSTNTFTATPTSDCTIRINMVEKPKFTVTLKDDNSTLTQVSYGATVTLPTRTGCTGYTFAGWTKSWAAAQTTWTTTAPTIIPAGSYTPSANENLYPVYTKTEGGGSTPASITLLPSDFGSSYPSGAQGSGTITKGDYSFTYGQYTQNQNGTPSQWCAGQLIQARCTLNIGLWNTTAMDITSVVLYKASPTSGSSTWAVYEGTASAKPTAGAISVSTGSASSITADKYENKSCSSGALTGMTETPLTYTASSGCKYINIAPTNGTSYFTKIVINYTETGGSTTSYISVPGCCTDWSTPTVSYSSSLAIGGTANVTISGTTHGAVTYESSDEDVLTVDADGTIHAVGAGTAHITATWAGDATYCEKSANSNDVTVSGIQVTGTTPVNFGQVYQGASIGTKTIYVTGLGLTNDITPSLPAGSPFSFSPASLAKDCSGATLTISANTATLGNYNQTLTLTSGSFSTTITVKMEVIAMPSCEFVDNLHNLTVDASSVPLSSYSLTAAQGTPVVFPTLANQVKGASTCEDQHYKFVGWTTSDNNTDLEDHLVTSHTLANGDAITYYAVWADGVPGVTYTKLTSNTFKTSPTRYVLGGANADNGTDYYLYSCTQTDKNNSWGYLTSDPATNTPIEFTLSGTAGELVATSTEATARYLKDLADKDFQMSASSKSVELKSDGTIFNNNTGETSYRLLYNKAGGLRWYSSNVSGSTNAYFYEVEAGSVVSYRTSCCADKVEAPTVTATQTSTSITLNWSDETGATGWEVSWNGGAFGSPSGTRTHTVSGLTPNTTYTWQVRATYTTPKCGADVRSGSTTTNQVYHVTYAKGSGTGTCTAEGSTTDATGYEAGATVTLQSNGFSLSGHVFNAWTEDDPDVTISNNQFTMPDHDVVITASWTAKMDKYFDRMHDQTDALHGGVEETEGTNEGKYYIPKEGCNYSVPTAVDSNTGDACQTSHYKLQGWIAASYVASDGTITQANLDAHLFSPTTRPTHTATGATYYAVWAEVTE